MNYISIKLLEGKKGAGWSLRREVRIPALGRERHRVTEPTRHDPWTPACFDLTVSTTFLSCNDAGFVGGAEQQTVFGQWTEYRW